MAPLLKNKVSHADIIQIYNTYAYTSQVYYIQRFVDVDKCML